MKNKYFKMILLGIAVFLLVSGLLYHYFIKNTKSIHIAFVGGLSGEKASNGQSLVEGVKLYLDKINQQGGVNGSKIVLDIFDDQNDSNLAEQKANEIVKQNKAVAVIGHWYSSCSLSGGPIYKENRIPAISPTSTNIQVTQENPWYFRTIFDDQLQGRFLAHYVKKIFQQNTVSIIHSDRAYGNYLAEVFAQSAHNLQITVKHRWTFKTDQPNLTQRLTEIAQALKAVEQQAGVIFIATHATEGIQLIKLIKDLDIQNIVIVPDAFASKTFQQGFNTYSKEKINPGYYSRGVYVTTPIIFDSASEKAHQFREEYRVKYQAEPGWRAAFAYDAAKVIVEAIKKTKISGHAHTLAQDRQKIRDYLAQTNHIEKAIEGVTGLNYFDDNGNIQKPVSIGVYKNKNIISALTQIQDIRYLNKMTDLQSALEEERVLRIDDKYMYKTNVVYTGIKINEISELHLSNLTYTLDFLLWFRYQGDIQPQEIKFLNAAEPIQLTTPVVAEAANQMFYRLYHVKGRFKADFWPSHHAFKQHLLGISFRHQQLTRNNLIYVTDIIGMGLTQGKSSLLQQLQQMHLFNLTFGWTIRQVLLFQDIAIENTLGNPQYIGGRQIEYSRFNTAILIKPDEFSFSRLFPEEIMELLMIVSVISLLGLIIISRKEPFRCSKTVLVIQTVFVFSLLLSSESVLLDWLLTQKVSTLSLEYLLIVFEILWWIIPTILLNLAAERFLWRPLEIRTERKVPNLIRGIFSLMIYTFTFFGLIAFVFDQAITSLLATSGVIAMIIGLAVQVNISNIFSGIAINLERPFRVGDWIQIGEFDEGKVINITWRTTQIQTRNNCILNIPNSTTSESTIHNFSYPNLVVEEWIFVYVDAIHQPEQVETILKNSLQEVKEILIEPSPFSRFRDVNDWAAEYVVGYYITDYAKKNFIKRMVWKSVWTHLNQAGITPAIQKHEVYLFQEPPLEQPSVGK